MGCRWHIALFPPQGPDLAGGVSSNPRPQRALTTGERQDADYQHNTALTTIIDTQIDHV